MYTMDKVQKNILLIRNYKSPYYADITLWFKVDALFCTSSEVVCHTTGLVQYTFSLLRKTGNERDAIYSASASWRPRDRLCYMSRKEIEEI
jgi:hypothetical protein